MKSLNTLRLVPGLLGFAIALAPIAMNAEIRSSSKEIVVMEPRDLPEQAQLPGNSFFLHSDDAGSTYLYIEQQQGARLTDLDVTDPASICAVASVALPAHGTFDFVRPLDGRAELIRFRDGKGVAVLDLHKARKPALRMVNAMAYLGVTQLLGESAVLAVNEPISNRISGAGRASPVTARVGEF